MAQEVSPDKLDHEEALDNPDLTDHPALEAHPARAGPRERSVYPAVRDPQAREDRLDPGDPQDHLEQVELSENQDER